MIFSPLAWVRRSFLQNRDSAICLLEAKTCMHVCMYACILYVCCMRRALGFLDIAFLACVICRVLVSEFCKGDVLSVIFERRLHWFGAGDRAHDLWRRSEMYSAERRPFYSEILSQMRPPRLQCLITAEQHSQGHGCKEKERERERVRDHKVWVVLKKLLEGEGKCLLKQKTLSLQKHKGPRLPGDRCACCDFFFLSFWHSADSYAWIQLRG